MEKDTLVRNEGPAY